MEIPTEVIKAAILIESWMGENAPGRWALMEFQSRDKACEAFKAIERVAYGCGNFIEVREHVKVDAQQ